MQKKSVIMFGRILSVGVGEGLRVEIVAGRFDPGIVAFVFNDIPVLSS